MGTHSGDLSSGTSESTLYYLLIPSECPLLSCPLSISLVALYCACACTSACARARLELVSTPAPGVAAGTLLYLWLVARLDTWTNIQSKMWALEVEWEPLETAS